VPARFWLTKLHLKESARVKTRGAGRRHSVSDSASLGQMELAIPLRVFWGKTLSRVIERANRIFPNPFKR